MAISAKFLADFTDFLRGSDAADKALGKLGTGAQRTNNTLGAFHSGLSQVDRTLSTMGVNIGPQVRALEELALASGKTATQIGLIGTAGLVMAAAIGGWEIGRWIANITGADEAFRKFGSAILGSGEAAQIAGAKQDALDRASARVGHTVTDLNEAYRINAKAAEDLGVAVNTSAHRVEQWHAEIAKVTSQGKIRDLKADLDAQHGTLKELSEQYGISTRALEFLKQEMTATAEEVAKTTKWFNEQMTGAAKAASDARNAAGIEQMNEAEETLKRSAKNAEGIWIMETEAWQMQLAERERLHKESVQRVEEEEKRAAAMLRGLTITGGASGLGARGTVTFDENGNMVTGGGSQFVPGSGVTVFSGAPTAMRSMSGVMSGGSVVVNAPISIVDTQENLARSIGNRITQAVLQGTKFS